MFVTASPLQQPVSVDVSEQKWSRRQSLQRYNCVTDIIEQSPRYTLCKLLKKNKLINMTTEK